MGSERYIFRWLRPSDATGRRGRLARTALSTLLIAMVVSFGIRASGQTKEHSLKAAYVYNFARYVTWPNGSSNESAFVIGVLGGSPIGDTLERIATKKMVHGRSVRIQQFATLTDYAGCDLLFISGAVEREVLAATIRQTDRQPVLLVAESEGFCQLGGTVNFARTVSGTVGIEINMDAIDRRRLLVDARLMKLATLVHDPRRSESP